MNRRYLFYDKLKDQTSFVLEKFYTIPNFYIISFYLILFGIGRIISLYEQFRFSLIHQVNLSIISFIEITTLKYFWKINHKFLEDDEVQEKEVCFIFKHIKKHELSIYNFLIPVLPCIIFSISNIHLGYVPISPVGIFALFMGCSAYFLGLVCYYQLIILVYKMNQLAQIDIREIPFLFPDDILSPPQWIRNISDLFVKVRKAFFTVGVLFTLEYILLMPPGIIEVKPVFQIHSNDVNCFIFSWMVIVVLIIIAFPIFMFYFKTVIAKIARNYKLKTARELSPLLKNNNSPDITALWSCYQLSCSMASLETSLMPQKSFFPIIATSISLALNILKLYESVLTTFFPTAV